VAGNEGAGPRVDAQPRLGVTFRSGDADCAAWLYLPAGGGPHPTIVMGHGLGATREMRLAAYAERFQAAGYACLVFDYRYLGASGGEPRQLLDVDSQLEDWRAALAYVRGRDDVNRDRIALWGTSFAGGHVLEIAAGDHRVAAVISQCPFTSGIASALAISPRSSIKVAPLALRDNAAARKGRDPVYVEVVGPPGSRALMTAADALPGVEALVEGIPEYENRLCARIGLRVIRYRPGRRVARIAAPVLFCICERDSVAPAAARSASTRWGTSTSTSARRSSAPSPISSTSSPARSEAEEPSRRLPGAEQQLAQLSFLLPQPVDDEDLFATGGVDPEAPAGAAREDPAVAADGADPGHRLRRALPEFAAQGLVDPVGLEEDAAVGDDQASPGGDVGADHAVRERLPAQMLPIVQPRPGVQNPHDGRRLGRCNRTVK